MRIHAVRTTLLRLGVVGIFASLLLVIIGCGGSEAARSSHPTYHGAVADVLSANCIACHSDGGIGPFPLDSPEWAVRMAPVIAYVVKEGIMPPWPPGPDTPPLENERKLSPEARSLLVAWAEGGTPLGEPNERARSSNEEETGRRTEADLSLVVDPPYSPDRSRRDDYRCFLLDPQLDTDTFVASYRVRPGLSALVHHALLFVIGPENADQARLLDESEDGPGWTCFGGPGVTSGIGGFGLLGFWVPGAAGSDFPEGTGKPLEAGSRLIMQLHYNLANADGTAVDASGVDLSLVEPSTDLKAIREIALAAPVEVRCPGPYPRESSDPCNRAYALKQSELKILAQGIHVLCGTRPEHYLQADIGDGNSQPTQCDQQIHVDSLALGVTGHMHLRGSSIRVELNPDTPGGSTLLHIPDWDFEWQGQYWFQREIPIKRGDTLRITCVYDNGKAIPGPDAVPLLPRYMTWGEATTDEMCLGAVSYVLP